MTISPPVIDYRLVIEEIKRAKIFPQTGFGYSIIGTGKNLVLSPFLFSAGEGTRNPVVIGKKISGMSDASFEHTQPTLRTVGTQPNA
jgi:hypothetical protein